MEEWRAALARSFVQLEGLPSALLAVDSASGRIVAGNGSARGLLGGALPGTLDEVVEAGGLSRPDADTIAGHLADGPGAPAWRADVRVHGADATVELGVVGVTIENTTLGVRTLVLLLHEHDRREPTVPVVPAPDVRSVLQFVYDRHMRVVSADPRMEDYGVDPESMVGSVTWLWVHPEDIPIAQPHVSEVLEGRAEVAEYTVRVVSPSVGVWTPAHIELRRLVAPGADLTLLANVTPVLEFRRTIAPDLLTDRELAIVNDLFAGRRVRQIATSAGVSEKTVRNQLTTIFKKLDVRDQADLLGNYNPPPRAGVRAAGTPGA